MLIVGSFKSEIRNASMRRSFQVENIIDICLKEKMVK